MALTAAISNSELTRVAAAAYEGRRVRVSLASVGLSGYTVESSTSNWDLLKPTSIDYADHTEVISLGAYDSTDARHELAAEDEGPFILAEFTASTVPLYWDRIYVVIGTDDGLGGWTEETFLHSLLVENPGITLSVGQSITYRIQLFVND